MKAWEEVLDMNYLKYCITPDLSVRDAMKLIGNTEPQIMFITQGKKLLASLTDGDIRRFLLRGGELTNSVIEAGNKKPLCAGNRNDAAAIYHREHYVAIPILDADHNLTDIYIGKRTPGEKLAELNIPVVINAGGKGTRLEPYTKILPKPLIPVGELPIIEHIMQRFAEYGCEGFHVIVNYKKSLMKAYFADSDRRYDITWYDEEQPLGTGGGLCYLKGKIEQTFFFTNCDSLLLSDYESMLRFHRQNGNMITMVCAYKNIRIPYGIIDMGMNGRIESMQEKPEFSFLTNTGIYIVEPEVMEDIEYNVPVDFPSIIEKEKAKNKKIAVYPINEDDWLDMGQLSELEKMRERLYGE